MNYSLKNIFGDRKNKFSNFWVEIVQTRFALCVVLALFTIFTPNVLRLKILVSIATYFILNFAFGFFHSNILQLKKVRVIPDIIDVIFISVLIYFTGVQSSPWFLLYLFPIISVSRYLSYEGTMPLMVLTIASYAFVVINFSYAIDYYSLLLKCLVFLAIALIVGDLARVRRRKENSLVDIFTEVENEILDNANTDKILRLMLEKALELTNSDMGQMKVLHDDNRLENSILKDESLNHDWNVDSLNERYFEKVIKSKKSYSILIISGKKQKGGDLSQDVQSIWERYMYVPIASIEEAKNKPNSALFVPLILHDKVSAIIALYSKHRLHYSQYEAIKLGSFAPLLGIALKNSEMYQEIADSETDKKARLKMLYEIGEQLKVEQGLSDVFQKVVDLTYAQLNSEESALFIWDEEKKVLNKEAVKGPTKEITEKLKVIEKPYRKGESLVGRIFLTKQYKRENSVSSNVEYHKEYSETLPSKKVCHYIGVPLIIGNEVLGVIRVINKRATIYSVENENFELTKNGFDKEDVELMQTIASQVASAIRSANFIEVQQYYRELVENSPDPIIVLDEEGKIKVFNKACEKIWGLSAGKVIGQPVENYYKSKEHAKEIGKMLWKSPNKRIQDFQAYIKDYKGDIIPISLSASRLFDKEDNEIGSIGVFKDLRATLKLHEEKTNAERLATLGKLAHTVGHEIKHDIATALNYIDTLAYECTDDEELSEIYHDVQESLSEAVDKFQNMLMVGRPKPPKKETIGVDDIFRRVEDTMRRRAESKKIDFLINYPDDEYELDADIAQLRQVLLNLFDNSIDAIDTKKYGEATKEKGQIELSAQANNGDLQITWKDNGCGISSQKISNIFTPFVTNKPTGNGLGLFIVKSIIENHGGNISVESEEGKETIFKIVLPLL